MAQQNTNKQQDQKFQAGANKQPGQDQQKQPQQQQGANAATKGQTDTAKKR